MKEQLLAALQGLITTIIDAKNFLVAEIPDVIREILLWAIVSHGALALVCVVVFCLCAKYVRVTIANCARHTDHPGWEFATGGLIISGVISFFVGINSFLYALKAWLAPKLFLIEYAVGLVKTCNSCGG